VYNNNHSRTQQAASLDLTAQYLNLDSSHLRCPYDCSGAGSCRDPFRMPVPMPGGDARLAPLEGDPFSEGFVCACDPGRGGLLCEGRQVNVSIGGRCLGAAGGGPGAGGGRGSASAYAWLGGLGRPPAAVCLRSSAPCTLSLTRPLRPPALPPRPPPRAPPGAGGAQDFGLHALAPGGWDFYALTLSDSFQRKQSSLAIEWVVTDPKDGNFSNALMAFNQGAFPRCAGGGGKGGVRG
jgi:hypothetical protein